MTSPPSTQVFRLRSRQPDHGLADHGPAITSRSPAPGGRLGGTRGLELSPWSVFLHECCRYPDLAAAVPLDPPARGHAGRGRAASSPDQVGEFPLWASRFRERRAAGVPVQERRPARPKPRPKRWAAALAELRTLQAEYEAWRDQLPESLADSRTAELLEQVCELDLDALDSRAIAAERQRDIPKKQE